MPPALLPNWSPLFPALAGLLLVVGGYGAYPSFPFFRIYDWINVDFVAKAVADHECVHRAPFRKLSRDRYDAGLRQRRRLAPLF